MPLTLPRGTITRFADGSALIVTNDDPPAEFLIPAAGVAAFKAWITATDAHIATVHAEVVAALTAAEQEALDATLATQLSQTEVEP